MNRLGLLFLFFAQACFAQPAIHIEKSGSGSPAIFLPGFTASGEVWQDTLTHLDKDLESHTVSYAGFNKHPPIALPWYDTIRSELIDYIVSNDLQDITLVGHSMGGMLAIDIAAAFPNRIKHLALIESIPNMRELMMPGVPAIAIQLDSAQNKMMLGFTPERFVNIAHSTAANMAKNAQHHPQLENWILEADRETYVYGYTELLQLDLRDKLMLIDIDTLIVGASYPDRDLVRSNYESQYQNLKNRTIIIADDSMHFVMFDEPEWFYTQLNEYLSR